MSILVFILFLVLASGSLGAELSYGLSLEVFPAAYGWELRGEAQISGVLPLPTATVFLRFLRGEMAPVRIASVRAGNEELAWDLIDPTTLAVELRGRSQTFSAMVSYSLPIPPFPTGGYGILAAGGDTVTVSQGYPIVPPLLPEGWRLEPVFPWGDSLVAEAADYRAWLRFPPGWEAVATGAEKVSSGGTEVVGRDLREFAFVLLSGYESEALEVNGAEVRSWFRPGEGDAGREALRLSADALEICGELFGNYPFPELDVVEVPLERAAGVEYPGLILAGTEYYLRFELGHRELIFPMIFAHEVAHQWWYAQVGNDQIREPWLDEALATYTSGLIMERWGLFEEILDYWKRTYELARERNPHASPFDPLREFPDGEGYGGLVYSGGALFFLDLEEAMGRERLLDALRRYLEEFRWRIATGEDLLSIMEEEGGEAVGEVIRNWKSSPPEVVHIPPGS